MGKHPGASPEELDFIFNCFLRGLQNKEVLAEMEDTEFPKRNPRFIQDRRNHFNAAKKALEKQGLLASEPLNWIEDWEKQHGELPLIPVFMLPVVKDKTAKRVSKNMKLSTPSAQWWGGLLPSQREQILQTVDWICKYEGDWCCKSREDYQAMIKRLIPGRPSYFQVHWKR